MVKLSIISNPLVFLLDNQVLALRSGKYLTGFLSLYVANRMTEPSSLPDAMAPPDPSIGSIPTQTRKIPLYFPNFVKHINSEKGRG